MCWKPIYINGIHLSLHSLDQMPHMEVKNFFLISYSPCITHDRKSKPQSIAACCDAQDHSDNFTRTCSEPVALAEPPLSESLCWLFLCHILCKSSTETCPFFNTCASGQQSCWLHVPQLVLLVKTVPSCNTGEKRPDRICPLLTLELEACRAPTGPAWVPQHLRPALPSRCI